MVNKQEWSEIEVSEEIEEMSLDGGMARLRTPLKEASEWREYKAININNQLNLAFFKDNESLVSWLKSQPFSLYSILWLFLANMQKIIKK